MRILVFGNPYLEYDSNAVKIAKELNDRADFIICTSPEQMMDYKFDYIMDVVEGIDEIKVFDNLKMLNPHKMFSLHDFDVTFFLGLMERLGKTEGVKIIGIPIQMSYEEAKEKIKNTLDIL